MALPITVPFTFANATTTQNLSSLDSDFSTVYNAVNGIGNGTVSLSNVVITGGSVNIAAISAAGTANATTFLRGDGAWANVASGGGSGTVTSVNAASANGFSFSGGPVTTSGTLTLNVPAPGTSGNVLTSNGSAWVSGTISTPQGAKAWVNFNGASSGTITPRANYNISSVTKNGTGDYTLNFTTALADSNYVYSGSGNYTTTTQSAILVGQSSSCIYSTTALQIFTSNSTTGAKTDPYSVVSVIIFGN